MLRQLFIGRSDTRRNLDDDEGEPLDGPATAKLTHTENIYSAMVFQPPLTRQQRGNYWAVEVLLTFALLILNITLQVTLATIAGGHLVSVDYDFKQSLIEGKLPLSPYGWFAQRYLKEPADEVVQRSAAFVPERLSWTGSNVEELINPRCCNGATCASLGLPCCDRSDAKPHTAYHPMRTLEARLNASKKEEEDGATDFLALRKPRKKKKKGEDDKVQEEDATFTERSICVANSSDMLFCNPLSYSFIDRWDDLDTDKDGKWSLDEARADTANLGCHLGIPPEDVFRSNCRGVVLNVKDTSDHHHLNRSFLVPESIIEYEAVPKAYFEWWAGLAVLCVGFDVTRCSDMVGRGLFDTAISSGRRWTTGGVHDLDSALDHCQRMLEPGGLCEQSLPGFYLTYRSRVREKCGTSVFSAGTRYVNPFNDLDAMTTVGVSYAKVESYVEHNSLRFRFFLCMVLMVWYVNLLDEFREIVKLIDFICCFTVEFKVNPFLTPYLRSRLDHLQQSYRSLSQPGLDQAELDQDGDQQSTGFKSTEPSFVHADLVVDAIAWPHWLMCIFLCMMRLYILVILFLTGTIFLLTDQGYLDLLLNSVALYFIIELPGFLYHILYSDRARKALEGAETINYETKLPKIKTSWSALLVSKAFWGLLILPVLVYLVVNFNYKANTVPVLEALRCTCLQEGPNCEVAHRFTRDWWDKYWKHIHFMFATNEGSYIGSD